MLKYGIAILIACLVSGIMYVTLNKKLCDKIKILNVLGTGEERESKEIKKSEMIFLIIMVALLSAVAVVRLFLNVTDIINIIRMLIIFFPLTGAACVDYREKRIPNFFPIFLGVAGIVFLVIEMIVNNDQFKSYMVSCLLACVGSFVILFIVGLIARMGIGAGDIKLLSTLGLVGGIYTLCGTVIYSTLVCAVVAVILLITKKKNLKSSLPFGPFIILGYILTIITNVY